MPVAVGFGIASPEQAAEVGRLADGVIIGSRLVRIPSDAENAADALSEVREFLGRTGAALAAG